MVCGIIVRSHYCCPINALSLRERVGVRGSDKANALIFHPLIPTFSRREKGRHIKPSMSAKANKCKKSPFNIRLHEYWAKFVGQQ